MGREFKSRLCDFNQLSLLDYVCFPEGWVGTANFHVATTFAYLARFADIHQSFHASSSALDDKTLSVHNTPDVINMVCIGYFSSTLADLYINTHSHMSKLAKLPQHTLLVFTAFCIKPHHYPTSLFLRLPFKDHCTDSTFAFLLSHPSVTTVLTVGTVTPILANKIIAVFYYLW
ncbi:hypothetical protein EVAR_55433_1 [Eumeta japonica]|uniref:Uncharacterized protein n=1 Tax=Eumeta variegata TaxID=151549 RepID=A0A4C1Z2B2_EUMVA|nr:hypothetical protein EVAR_55433_1 [Eumeta japonica]